MPATTHAEPRSPLYEWHRAHGAVFTNIDGWNVPSYYSSAANELAAARSGAGLTDLSSFAKTRVQGQGGSTLPPDVVGAATAIRSVSVLAGAGQTLACRLRLDHLLILAGPEVAQPAESFKSTIAPLRDNPAIVITDVTSAYAGFCLTGPQTLAILRKLTAFDVSSTGLPPATCAETSLAGVWALLIHPPNRPLTSVRVYVAWELGEYVWGSLLEAGRILGLTPMGLDAWRSLEASG